MTDRKRDPLPDGYQYLDARGDGRLIEFLNNDEGFVALRMLINSLKLRSEFTASVIEGEHFASDAEQHPVIEGEPTT